MAVVSVIESGISNVKSAKRIGIKNIVFKHLTGSGSPTPRAKRLPFTYLRHVILNGCLS